jgi:hypothetical protein
MKAPVACGDMSLPLGLAAGGIKPGEYLLAIDGHRSAR